MEIISARQHTTKILKWWSTLTEIKLHRYFYETNVRKLSPITANKHNLKKKREKERINSGEMCEEWNGRQSQWETDDSKGEEDGVIFISPRIDWYMGLSIETVIGLTRQPDFNCQTIGPDNSQLTCTIVIDCVWLDLCSRSAHRHENGLFMCSQRCRSWKIIVAKHFDYCRLGVCVCLCV